jgi:hypothetical protein
MCSDQPDCQNRVARKTYSPPALRTSASLRPLAFSTSMRNSARYVPGLRPGFAISTVKGIPDPERRLFDFLVSKLKPKSTDEKS